MKAKDKVYDISAIIVNLPEDSDSELPGDQEGLFKLAIQLRKFSFITL
jgi:hypothetical protein